MPLASMVQAKLRIGAPNDRFEQEADRIAESVMRTSDGGTFPALSAGSAGIRQQRKCAACSSAGHLCPECEKEEKQKVRRKPSDARPLQTTGAVPRLSAGVEARLRAFQGGGQPLPERERAFFEPRLGADLSHVRIHTGTDAAETAAAIQARAFTTGPHIVFGAGEYLPTSRSRQLLAHELVHTVQQEAGDVRVRRAIIPYRAITWADFLAAPPVGHNPDEGAGILSRFDLMPTYTPVITAKPTKKPCRAGKVSAMEVETTAAPDPADFNKPEAVMDQDQSWALPRYTGNGNDFCTAEVTRCENQFNSVQATIRANCEKSAGECERAFDNGEKAFGIAVGGDSVRVTRKADCRGTFLTRCQQMTSKAASVSMGSTVVRTREDCKKTYFNQCLAGEVNERARLLRHEQGHFDITNVMARNARESIKLKAAGLSVNEKGCGEDAARDAARNTYKSNVGAPLQQLGSDWLAARGQAQQDYDGQTHNGSNAAKQKAWEAAIAAGLKAYIPASAPAPAAPQPQPPANPPANPPGSPPINPPASPPAANPKRERTSQ